MPLITISCQHEWTGAAYKEQVIADLYGPFAVHATVRGEPGQFQLTHVPTGFAYLSRVSHADAVAAAQEIIAGPLDWSAISTVNDLTPAHKAQGRAIRAKYPEDPVGKNGSIFRLVLWSATPPNAETRQLMANCLGALAEAHDESVPDL